MFIFFQQVIFERYYQIPHENCFHFSVLQNISESVVALVTEEGKTLIILMLVSCCM